MNKPVRVCVECYALNTHSTSPSSSRQQTHARLARFASLPELSLRAGDDNDAPPAALNAPFAAPGSAGGELLRVARVHLPDELGFISVQLTHFEYLREVYDKVAEKAAARHILGHSSFRLELTGSHPRVRLPPAMPVAELPALLRQFGMPVGTYVTMEMELVNGPPSSTLGFVDGSGLGEEIVLDEGVDAEGAGEAPSRLGRVVSLDDTDEHGAESETEEAVADAMGQWNPHNLRRMESAPELSKSAQQAACPEPGLPEEPQLQRSASAESDLGEHLLGPVPVDEYFRQYQASPGVPDLSASPPVDGSDLVSEVGDELEGVAEEPEGGKEDSDDDDDDDDEEAKAAPEPAMKIIKRKGGSSSTTSNPPSAASSKTKPKKPTKKQQVQDSFNDALWTRNWLQLLRTTLALLIHSSDTFVPISKAMCARDDWLAFVVRLVLLVAVPVLRFVLSIGVLYLLSVLVTAFRSGAVYVLGDWFGYLFDASGTAFLWFLETIVEVLQFYVPVIVACAFVHFDLNAHERTWSEHKRMLTCTTLGMVGCVALLLRNTTLSGPIWFFNWVFYPVAGAFCARGLVLHLLQHCDRSTLTLRSRTQPTALERTIKVAGKGVELLQKADKLASSLS